MPDDPADPADAKGPRESTEDSLPDDSPDRSLFDHSYLAALELRHAALTAERDEAAEAIKSVGAADLETRTRELQQLEADTARIWEILKGARGKSPRP